MNKLPKRHHILVHLHIFKNAGSSIDSILKQYFDTKWLEYDTSDPGGILLVHDIVKLLNENRGVTAFSSHQMRMPLPVMLNRIVHPIVFVRHPIDRVLSCYNFEILHQQKRDPQEYSFEDYVLQRLKAPKINSICNLQTSVLCDNRFLTNTRKKSELNDYRLSEAKRTLSSLAVFGMVEEFSESMKRYNDYFQDYFPKLHFENVHVNVSSNRLLELDKRLSFVKDSLSKEVYAELLLQNQCDLDLYGYAKELFNQ